MQKGNISLRGTTWLLRYYEPVLSPDGKVIKRPKAVKLASYGPGYRTERDVQPLADVILAPINARMAPVLSSQTVADFLQYVFIPHCQETLRAVTVKSYNQTRRRLTPYLGDLELRKTRTSDIDRILRAFANDKQPAHTTLKYAKAFLSSAFRFAVRTDRIAGNPVSAAVVPRGRPRKDQHAYTLEEIQVMLEVLPEPARTIVTVAAFTGLRVSEMKGLRWEDLHGEEMHVERSVWNGRISDTKTVSSRAPVPLVPIVKRALIAHRNRQPEGAGFIFEGGTRKPLQIENVYYKTMRPIFAEHGITCWAGWHGFRRGVGTNLAMLGVPVGIVQRILRHTDAATTQQFYVRPRAEESSAALRRLEKAFSELK